MKKIIPVLLLILLFGCKKNEVAPLPAASFGMADFPIAIGNSWTYLVTNFPATHTDTATIKIVGIGPLVMCGPSIFETQTIIKGVVVDSGIIGGSMKTISFAGDNGRQTFAGSGLFDGWDVVLPMQANSKWTANEGSVEVISADQNVVVQGNSYSHVYVMARTALNSAGWVHDTMYIAPGVGIIKWAGFPLLSYHLE